MAYVGARQEFVRVVVGLEDAFPGMRKSGSHRAAAPLGALEAGYRRGDRSHAQVQYQETIGAVSFIAQLSDRILQVPQ